MEKATANSTKIEVENTKPKVLFILHLPPPVHGAAMVGKSIHDSILVNETFATRYHNLATSASLQEIGKFRFRKLFDFIGLYWNIRREVRAFNPDLVYITPNATGLAFFKDFLIVQSLKRMGCRVVMHFHNKGFSSKRGNWLYNFCYKRFFNGTKVILLSKYLYDDARAYVSESQLFVCHNGTAPIGLSAHSREAANTEPHLLFLSNLMESKGLFCLLEACRELKLKGYQFVCDIVGAETPEVSEASLHRQIALMGVEDVVRYHGKCYGEAKEKMFAQSDVFVFPSYNEAFPLVLLEAMQHHLPIVSTREGGIPDILKEGENGLFCNKKDAASLARVLERLLDDEDLRRQMGEQGYKSYQEKFTLRHFEENMTRILLECASSHS